MMILQVHIYKDNNCNYPQAAKVEVVEAAKVVPIVPRKIVLEPAKVVSKRISH